MARKVVLWKRQQEPDPTADLVSKYFAADSDDGPELDALVKATVAELRAADARVEIRKREPEPAGVKPVTPSIEELDARLRSSKANIAALDARELIAKGGHENAVTANEIFERHPDAYDAYLALERGERWQAPVVKAEKDYREEIRRLLRAHDHKGLRELLEKSPEASRQYRRLVMAGKGF